MNDWDPLSEQSMREILPWKLHGLTHNDTIKAHHLFTATAKKTPYQLDLEVKDRKPDIVPKVGDKVKIKSREWYEKWKNAFGRVRFSGTECIFSEEMDEYCGEEFTVIEINDTLYGKRWILELAPYSFIPEMFEEVYPQESSKEVISAINPVQGIGIATDWSKLVSSTETRIISPQQSSFCNAGFYCQSVLKDEEPELQTIKKHRFIKLEKL